MIRKLADCNDLLLPKTDCGEARKVEYSISKSDHRSDIAVLRAIAIIAVFAFHFYPKIFPQGFLGVDIFFVISGYLIMRILSISDSPPFKKISTFYYRRIKRIFPLFYLVLAITGFAMLFIYSIAWTRRYFPFFSSSVYMRLNLRMETFDMSYFDQKLEGLPFLHTWSLGVEIQFYLLAPLLFYISKLKWRDYRFGLILILFIALSSFYLNLTDSPSRFTFYNPFVRLWQFLTGMIACVFSRKTNEEIDMKSLRLINNISIFFFFGIFGVFIPVGNNLYLQTLTTIAAALFILSASYGDISWSHLGLNYIASLSYALYLVHYPVLEYTKYIAKFNEMSISANLIGFMVTVLLSIALHHFFEKPLLKKEKSVVIPVIITLILTCLVLNLSWRFGYTQFKAKNPASDWNLGHSEFDFNLKNGKFMKIYDTKGPMGHFQFENGTGPLRVMVIGNSYAPQRALVLNKIFPKTIRSTLDLVAYPGKVILYQKFSKDFAIYLWELIEKRKPHFVFISMRYVKANGDFDPFEETDRRTKKYLNAIQHLSLHSRKIFIETALPFHCEPFVEIKNIANTEDFLNDFVDHLERNATLEKLNLSVDKSFFDAGPAIRRLEFIAKKCPKCHLIHLEEPYFDKEKEIFRMFDPISRKAYIDNRCHFTPSGLHLQFELFRKAVQPHIHKFLREKHLK